MKKYLNYLVKNPSKLLFALGGTIFTLFLIVITLVYGEDIVYENSITFFVFIELFLGVLLFTVYYQVYKEWKDGLNR